MATLALHPQQSKTPMRIRINRRGWAVLVGIPVFLLTIAAAFMVTMFTSSAQASTDLPTGPATVEVTVIPGDTLWGLASEYAVGYEVNAAMSHIEELNSIDAGVLYAGDTLDIPVLSN
ncbi:LysM peptidoglycan-binding domain-containing protein [Glutamicibacter sp. AOP12-B1-11]|uniref:LysM peptidoglycan-binding domain-containing protein n=1 Tax=Micrococcaceae TaxID=1268 RepID=UPI0011B0EBF3|nr:MULTISPECIES: LysM peptidoglycan-binding domain-containing protein [unclassified Arthrobacter]